MNQLINIENMSLDQLKEIEIQLTKKKVEILGREIERLDYEHKETKHVVKEQEGKIEKVDSKVDYLKENMILDSRGVKKIQNAGQLKVVQALGGKESPAYKEFSHKLFANFWRYYCYRLEVGTYKDTRAEDFNRAMEHITNWKPAKDVQSEIDFLNSQIQIDL